MGRRFYTAAEVSVHNHADDCWVSFLGRVFDVTSLIRSHQGPLAKPLIDHAGQDISHWFDAETGDVKRHVDPVRGVSLYYVPQGRFVGIPESLEAEGENVTKEAWWFDEQHCIGKLSTRARKIRIVNTLTHDEHVIEVCSEETLDEIQSRYLEYNAHAGAYTWKRLGKKLDMTATLAQNGVEDESETFETLSLDDEFYIPALHLYFNDDLTVA